jgi:hypothetical protein
MRCQAVNLDDANFINIQRFQLNILHPDRHGLKSFFKKIFFAKVTPANFTKLRPSMTRFKLQIGPRCSFLGSRTTSPDTGSVQETPTLGKRDRQWILVKIFFPRPAIRLRNRIPRALDDQTTGLFDKEATLITRQNVTLNTRQRIFRVIFSETGCRLVFNINESGFHFSTRWTEQRPGGWN